MAFKYDTTAMPQTLQKSFSDMVGMVAEMTDLRGEIENLGYEVTIVGEVIDNVQHSLDLLSSMSDSNDIVTVLNIDGSIEGLLAASDTAMTRANVTKALEDSGESLWQRFKNLIKKIFGKIREYLTQFWQWITGASKKQKEVVAESEQKGKDVLGEYSKAPPEKRKAALEAVEEAIASFECPIEESKLSKLGEIVSKVQHIKLEEMGITLNPTEASLNGLDEFALKRTMDGFLDAVETTNKWLKDALEEVGLTYQYSQNRDTGALSVSFTRAPSKPAKDGGWTTFSRFHEALRKVRFAIIESEPPVVKQILEVGKKYEALLDQFEDVNAANHYLRVILRAQATGSVCMAKQVTEISKYALYVTNWIRQSHDKLKDIVGQELQ